MLRQSYVILSSLNLNPNNMPDLGSAISSGLSLLGGVSSAAFSGRQSKKQLLTQVQENEKNRQFNAAQASLSRTYNTQSVNQARYYDSPQAMMQRLKDAGLNPNLVYGDIGSGSSVTVGNTGQSASSSGSAGTSLPDYSGLLNGIRAAADISLIKAQTDNVKADTENKESQTKLNGKALEYYDELQQSNIANINADTSLKVTQKDVGEEEKKNLAKSTESLSKGIEKMSAEIRKLNQETTNLSVDEQIRRVEAYFKSSEYQAQLNLMYAQANAANSSAYLSRTQANDLIQTLFYRQMALEQQANEASASAWLKRSQRVGQNKENQLLDIQIQGSKIDLDVKEDTAHAAAWINIIGEGIGSIAGAALGFGAAAGGVKAIKGMQGAKSVSGFAR